ncbi:nickel pincer cofactor biosynthesis protein LarC [Clostridium sp. HV4-5-A1G]|uniref:nickel pincer cofactor biosynthesis protein LarC n=2 Tax=Clostridium sp. HV4-5-A1G TaxID=2004595 RepID=UPI00123AB990|nr:nickel pincer cofactor biosynthesis protein LarC [Clostridium sp. HV4-5-A1G]KAA8675905.1 nickel pincer cofactor biosynthesis protein LarC [Clostridium sp. HV4-5-A1G]
MMKILYYDCFSGISGDMNLGALIDLGVDVEYLTTELSKLKVKGYEINTHRDIKNGISGTKVDVILKKEHDHASHHHRNLNDIEDIINYSDLNVRVKNISVEIFKKVAEAEAKVHNKPLNEIHFHEVGAVDSIVDIVGAAVCFDYLKVDKVEASKVEVGRGFVKCAHGVFPVPAPATAEILKDIPIKSEVPFEATTPTGAAILSYFSSKYTENKNFKIAKIGYGIGNRDNDGIPDVLRVFLGETIPAENDGKRKNFSENKNHKIEYISINREKLGEHDFNNKDYKVEDIQVIECNIDDMNPEMYQCTMDALLENGASDVYLTPIIMKKERPAVKLTVLYKSEIEEKMREIILTQTTTIGFRKYKMQRNILNRDFTKVITKYGEVNVKNAYYKGKKIKSKIEYEDCKKLALKNKVGIQEVYRETMAKLLKQ